MKQITDNVGKLTPGNDLINCQRRRGEEETMQTENITLNIEDLSEKKIRIYMKSMDLMKSTKIHRKSEDL